MRGRPGAALRLVLGLPLVSVALTACGDPPPPWEPFLLEAAQALGPEAHKGRQRVVNPILVALDEPRLTPGALEAFRDAGFEVLADTGEEDPEKATYYFTVPSLLEDGGYQVRVHVSMGSRYGVMERGDSWWRITGRCGETCRILEVEAVGNRAWR